MKFYVFIKKSTKGTNENVYNDIATALESAL